MFHFSITVSHKPIMTYYTDRSSDLCMSYNENKIIILFAPSFLRQAYACIPDQENRSETVYISIGSIATVFYVYLHSLVKRPIGKTIPNYKSVICNMLFFTSNEHNRCAMVCRFKLVTILVFETKIMSTQSQYIFGL